LSQLSLVLGCWHSPGKWRRVQFCRSFSRSLGNLDRMGPVVGSWPPSAWHPWVRWTLAGAQVGYGEFGRYRVPRFSKGGGLLRTDPSGLQLGSAVLAVAQPDRGLRIAQRIAGKAVPGRDSPSGSTRGHRLASGWIHRKGVPMTSAGLEGRAMSAEIRSGVDSAGAVFPASQWV
jgi:hypothetical protein